MAIASTHSLVSDLLGAGDLVAVNPLLTETHGVWTATLMAMSCTLIILSWWSVITLGPGRRIRKKGKIGT